MSMCDGDGDGTAPPPTPPASGRGVWRRFAVSRASEAGPGVDKGDHRPTERARELRAIATNAEQLLWRAISARKVAAVRFNRQFPIGPFICDFVSRGAKLIIELDGDHHELQTEADARRTRYLEAQGYRVLRFWNREVFESLEGVVAKIEGVLRDIPCPNPSREREGDL